MTDWQQLVISYQPLLYSIAHKYENLLELDDLISAGNIGLIRYAKKYATLETHKYAFATGARLAIGSAMIDLIRQCRGRAGQKVDVLSYDSYDGDERAHQYPAPDDTEAEVIMLAVSEAVRDALAQLSPLYQFIIIQCYVKAETLVAVSTALGIPDYKVRQLREAAIADLRCHLIAAGYAPVPVLAQNNQNEQDVRPLASAGAGSHGGNRIT